MKGVHVYLYVLCGFNSQTVKLIINRNLRYIYQYLSEFRLLLPYVGLCVAETILPSRAEETHGGFKITVENSGPLLI